MSYDAPADRSTNAAISELMGLPMSDPDLRRHLSPYSTDIASAWRVIEHVMNHWIFSKRIAFFKAIANQVRTHDGYPIAWPDALGVLAKRRDFPLVICRAALVAEEKEPNHA